jgi:hypothetical protein
VVPYVPVKAPPELCTIPERGSAAVDEAVVDDVPGADPVGSLRVTALCDADSGDVAPVVTPASADTVVEAGCADFAELPESVPAEDWPVSDGEPAADPDSGLAHATPGVVATAVPMPNATANAPTRPTYRA